MNKSKGTKTFSHTPFDRGHERHAKSHLFRFFRIPDYRQFIRFSLACTLSTLLLATAWQDTLLYLVFKIQQKKLTAVVCQNKDKPELQCKAACYFKTKLDKEHKKEQNDNNNSSTLTPKEKVSYPKNKTDKFLNGIAFIQTAKTPIPLKTGSLSPAHTSRPFKPPA